MKFKSGLRSALVVGVLVCAGILGMAIPTRASALSSTIALTCEPNTCDVTSVPSNTASFQWGWTFGTPYSSTTCGNTSSCTLLCKTKQNITMTASALDSTGAVIASASHAVECSPEIP